MEFKANSPQGFTVHELHEIFLTLIVAGHRDSIVFHPYENSFLQPMVYVGANLEYKRVAISEAF